MTPTDDFCTFFWLPFNSLANCFNLFLWCFIAAIPLSLSAVGFYMKTKMNLLECQAHRTNSIHFFPQWCFSASPPALYYVNDSTPRECFTVCLYTRLWHVCCWWSARSVFCNVTNEMVCTLDSNRVDVKFINYKNTSRPTSAERWRETAWGRVRSRKKEKNKSANMKQQVLDDVCRIHELCKNGNNGLRFSFLLFYFFCFVP